MIVWLSDGCFSDKFFLTLLMFGYYHVYISRKLSYFFQEVSWWLYQSGLIWLCFGNKKWQNLRLIEYTFIAQSWQVPLWSRASADSWSPCGARLSCFNVTTPPWHHALPWSPMEGRESRTVKHWQWNASTQKWPRPHMPLAKANHKFIPTWKGAGKYNSPIFPEGEDNWYYSEQQNVHHGYISE